MVTVQSKVDTLFPAICETLLLLLSLPPSISIDLCLYRTLSDCPHPVPLGHILPYPLENVSSFVSCRYSSVRMANWFGPSIVDDDDDDEDEDQESRRECIARKAVWLSALTVLPMRTVKKFFLAMPRLCDLLRRMRPSTFANTYIV